MPILSSLVFADEVSETPEKQKQDESVQNVIGMNFAFSMSAVKQADAKPMQSLVEQIKAKAEAETATAAEPTSDATEPETPTNQRYRKSRQGQSLPTKLSNQEPEEPTG